MTNKYTVILGYSLNSPQMMGESFIQHVNSKCLYDAATDARYLLKKRTNLRLHKAIDDMYVITILGGHHDSLI